MKGCALFAASFLLGIGLIVSGIIYDVTMAQNIELAAFPARVLEVSGLTVSFGTIFVAAGLAFYRRLRAEKAERAAKL
jgi:hypothetical protein